METKSFYEIPAVKVVEVKAGGLICGSDPLHALNSAMRSGYGNADEI